MWEIARLSKVFPGWIVFTRLILDGHTAKVIRSESLGRESRYHSNLVTLILRRLTAHGNTCRFYRHCVDYRQVEVYPYTPNRPSNTAKLPIMCLRPFPATPSRPATKRVSSMHAQYRAMPEPYERQELCLGNRLSNSNMIPKQNKGKLANGPRSP